MNNTYLFLVYSLCAITIIYLIHTVILTELNKYNKYSDKGSNNKTGDDNYDYDDNQQMAKYKLRGIYIDSIEQQQMRIINNNMMYHANDRIRNSGYFTIMCIELLDRPIEKCKSHDGYKEWLLQEKRRYGTITLPNINKNIIRNRIIYKLQNVFINSNITQSYKNCCDHYKITW